MSFLCSWGANSHGQLGQNLISEQCISPQHVASPCWDSIISLAVGGGHSVILDNHGKLFACGWNNHYQLGTEDRENKVFNRIWNLSGILFKAVSCGWDGTCAITNDDHLYVWGSNCYGQLGIPTDHYPKTVRPIKLELRVASISMGMRHTAVIDLNGSVWITGVGKSGQLGLGREVIMMDRFTKIPNLGNISLIACGQYHTLAYSTQENILYAWGDNRFGQLFNRQETRVFNPVKVETVIFDDKIKQLQSGWTHSAALTQSGKLYLWGRNNYGQLGSPDEMTSNQINIGEDILEIALGSEHGMCLTADKRVWSWGWNEHGNTGIDSCEEIIWKPTELKFKENCKPQNIYSGSGHNFAVFVSE